MKRHKDLLDCCDGYFHRAELKYNERERYSPTIYFLTRKDKIVYIGETVKPCARFKSHTQKTPTYKEWDKVFFKTFDEYVKGEHLRYIEGRSLTYLNELTEYNRRYNIVGNKNENPLDTNILNEYLLKTKKEVEEWRNEYLLKTKKEVEEWRIENSVIFVNQSE